MSNHIPAAHFHTVVNALHERACGFTSDALDADLAAERAENRGRADLAADYRRDAATYRKLSAENREAFRVIMRNAPVVDGFHRCGLYKVEA